MRSIFEAYSHFILTFFFLLSNFISFFQLYAQFSEHELPNLTHLHLRVATLNRESLLGLASIMKACPFLQTLIVQVNVLMYYLFWLKRLD